MDRNVEGVDMDTRLTLRSWDVVGLTWLQLRLALYQLAQVHGPCPPPPLPKLPTVECIKSKNVGLL